MARALGITSLQILGALRPGRAYGLEIVSQTRLPSGTVYPTLGRLEKNGLVRGAWEDHRIGEREGRPRRRYYELSGEGARVLAEGASRIAHLASELGEALEGV